MDMNPPPVLIYDGQCPFCANYVRLLRLRESLPRLELINARAHPDHPAIQQLKDRGLQIVGGENGDELAVHVPGRPDMMPLYAETVAKRQCRPFLKEDNELRSLVVCSEQFYEAENEDHSGATRSLSLTPL